MKPVKMLLIFGIVLGLTMTGSLCIEKYGEQKGAVNVTIFKTKEEMTKWVQSAYSKNFGFYMPYMPVLREPLFEMPVVTPIPTPTPGPLKSLPERVSETNVQVIGIDEPDIVKTDGEKIYFSKIRYPWWMGTGNTKVIKAFPPKELKVEYEINKSGKLLLANHILVLLGSDSILGYDVSGKAKKIWDIELNGSLVSARLYNNTIYVVTRSEINYFNPCPIKPLKYNGKVLEVNCNQIYHPTYPVYVDSVYTVAALEVKSGEVKKAVSFVGSSGKTVVYMSKNAIYVTYPENRDPAEIYYDFMKENRDMFPDKVVERVERLLNYDISEYSKFVEINIILEQYKSSLDKDDRLKFENEFWNRLDKYYDSHKRELEKTGIVKISLDLNVEASGRVAGRPLNQFSIDEYGSYLRIATTVGFRNTTNDLYVLDSNLKVVGKITDYGEGERIYAVRFLMDKGYIVTFKETDPLYVVDLSNPEKPEIKGELKIPGYSSYLHPIDKDTIIGIGKDGRNVKISLFNVSNAEKPTEIDSYLLKEYWSDILKTHHAFLIDKKHNVFFLPASNGGYIFSYENGLKLEKAVSVSALRAIYINDYMYIIGDKVIVLNENTWEKVSEIEL